MSELHIKTLTPCSGRTLVMGDVHGCAEELATLIRAFAPRPGDRMVAVGDLINRGPDSRGVLDLVREWKIEAVLGNHENRLLKAYRSGNPGTLKSKDANTYAVLRDKDFATLTGWPHFLHIPSLKSIVVHGGIDPANPWPEQVPETILTIQVLDEKGAPARRADAPTGTPWAANWKGPEHIFYGHTPRPHPLCHPYATGLDTGCVYGYTLTAVVLPEIEFLRVHARKAYVQE